MGSGEIEQPIPRGERSGEAGSARQFVTDLIQRQGLHVGTLSEYCLMWSDLSADTVRRKEVSPEVHRTINNISLGIDFLAFTKRYDQLSPGQHSYIPQKFSEIRQEEGINHVVLPYDDATLLQLAAAVVNIAYDPGELEETPENIKKRTFVFAELEDLPPSTATVVDADK
jgi:hypothetical protein